MGLKENIKYITQTSTASIANIFFSIVRSKIVAVLIGTGGFGIVGQLSSLMNISHFLVGMGMEKGLVSEIARAKRNEDEATYQNLSRTFFILTSWFSVLLALVVFLFAPQITSFLFASQEYLWFVKLSTPAICTLGLHIGYTTLLAANKRIKALVIKSILTSFLSSGFTVLMVYLFDVDGIVYGLLVNGVLNILLGAYFVRKCNLVVDAGTIFFSVPHKSSFLKLFRYGSVLVYSSLIYQVVNLGIKNIIIEKATIDEVGIFQAATNISKQYMPIFLVSLSTYLLPLIVGVETLGGRIKETNASLKALLLLATPVLFFILCFSAPLIRLLYSPEFVLSASLLSILVISDFLGLVNKVASTFLISERKMKLIFILDTFVATVMYCFVYLTFDTLGLISAIYASVLASLVYFILVVVLLELEFTFRFELRTYLFIIWILLNMAAMIFLFNEYSVWFKLGYFILLFTFTYSIFIGKSDRKELIKLVSFYFKHYGKKSN